MKAQCSAVHEGWNGKRCKATSGLVAVEITTAGISGLVKLPAKVLIYLCPKHFGVRA